MEDHKVQFAIILGQKRQLFGFSSDFLRKERAQEQLGRGICDLISPSGEVLDDELLDFSNLQCCERS